MGSPDLNWIDFNGTGSSLLEIIYVELFIYIYRGGRKTWKRQT